jgi:hypothetical protein
MSYEKYQGGCHGGQANRKVSVTGREVGVGRVRQIIIKAAGGRAVVADLVSAAGLSVQVSSAVFFLTILDDNYHVSTNVSCVQTVRSLSLLSSILRNLSGQTSSDT